MPSTSAKQHRTMEAAAHNPAFAKKMGIPQSVAREYVTADKGHAPVTPPPRHHTTHDMPMKMPDRHQGTHDAPTKPGY